MNLLARCVVKLVASQMYLEELGLSLRKLPVYWYITVSLIVILTTVPLYCNDVVSETLNGWKEYRNMLWNLYMMIHPQTMRYFYKRQILAQRVSMKTSINNRSFQNSAWCKPPYVKDIFKLKVKPYILRRYFRAGQTKG